MNTTDGVFGALRRCPQWVEASQPPPSASPPDGVDPSCWAASGCGADTDPHARPPNGIAALIRLCAGNARFIADRTTHPGQGAAHRAAVAEGQTPFAVILGCVDSRVPPELVFDRGLGDLFVVRSAGQTLDEAVLGSIEFGISHLGIPLLVVLGHDNCGAIKATLDATAPTGVGVSGTMAPDAAPPSGVDALIEAIRPAVDLARAQTDTTDHRALIHRAVLHQISNIVRALARRPALAGPVTTGDLTIVGAHYDLETGSVTFGHPDISGMFGDLRTTIPQAAVAQSAVPQSTVPRDVIAAPTAIPAAE